MEPRRARLVGLLAAPLVVFACVLGEERAPGCDSDAECGPDRRCRAGACFGTTTERSPAGEGGDGAGASGGGGGGR